MKSETIQIAGEHKEQKELLLIVGGNAKWFGHWRKVW
jgi:hypothetical protein